ncbi:MAG: sulfatase-like hydrolase/transferase [Phycisphaeraceae bacterium]|nr:sulfatase-like hydrolase/transferase [Phycisphaeraceae bacterium]
MIEPQDKRPNILLILTDQMRADAIHAMGNPLIRTPNLDRLIQSGRAFTSAYSSSPVCVPARASMHYGQYPSKTKCLSNSDPMPMDGRPSYVQLLTDAGFRTHGIGKCHFTPDRGALRGFQTRETQEEVPACIEDDDYLQWLQGTPYAHVREPHGVFGDMIYLPQLSPLPESHHPTQWIGDRSIAFIEEQSKQAKPWFLFASFVHPHPPYSPPYSWMRSYCSTDMPEPHMPPNYLHDRPAKAQSDLYYYHMEGEVNVRLWQRNIARYYACVSFVDHQVGRICDSLQASGQMDNTLIIFTSDHGDMLGDWGCLGKENMLEASARVPLIISSKGIVPEGSVDDGPVSLVDIAPTVLGAAGIDHHADLDGADLRKPRNPDRVVFSHVLHQRDAQYMALNKNWKYIFSARDNREYLFDRMSDRQEHNDLLGQSEVAEVVANLKTRLLDNLRTNNQIDVLNAEGTNWRLYIGNKRPMRRRPDTR